MKNKGVMITWGISSALVILFVIGCSLIAATPPLALLIPPTANLTVVEILPVFSRCRWCRVGCSVRATDGDGCGSGASMSGAAIR